MQAQLRLTPFEEYMLMDNHPAYPMSCFMVLKFKGQLQLEPFAESLHRVLERHPFLTSCAVEVKPGIYCWEKTNKPIEIKCVPPDPDRLFPHAEGIDLFKQPAMNVTLCAAEDRVTLYFEFHHSACDAGGAARFLEDVLLDYALQLGNIVPETVREPVQPELLQRRGKYGLTPKVWLKILPKQLWGLTRAWMFLLNRVIPLTSDKPLLSNTKPSEKFPAILARELDRPATLAVRNRAKSAGVTINDVLLNATFQAMNEWRSHRQIKNERGYFRIAVPTNLRNPADRLMPAANIVSMVFLDRKPKKIQNDSAFLRSIHREMQHIKRCNLGLAFIHGLTVYRKFFGSFTKMIQQGQCWTTATVSNLGSFFADIPLPRRDGWLQFGNDLELHGVDSSPPIRPWTPLGVCAMTYADRMTLNLHYDSDVLSRDEAETIFETLIDRL